MHSPRFFRAVWSTAAALAFILVVPVWAQRQDSELSGGWKFIRQDVGLQAPVDSSWTTVTVPHTWNAFDIQQPVDKAQRHGDYSSGYYRGPGWYERTLAAPRAWRGKRVFLRFEAASLVAQVYLNGQEIGEHQGGFTAFCIELTPHLHLGADNELRVRVDNARQADLAPLSGDFNVGGGLYRPVHLLVTGALCISPLDFASPGVYLTPQAISDASAGVAVKVMLSRTAGAPTEATIATEIRDADGALVARQSDPVPAGDSYKAVLTVPHPHRWNGRKDPYLYSVTVRLMAGGHELDAVTQPLGLRTVAIWGSFIWCLTDFTSSRRQEGGTNGINDKGLVTYDRKIRKDAYFFYQANWSEVPMVHIAGRRATPRTLAATQVEVFSNCPAVTLRLNGTPLPAVQPDAVHVFRWPVTLQPGRNRIDATATGNGPYLHDSMTWTLTSSPSPAPSGGT